MRQPGYGAVDYGQEGAHHRHGPAVQPVGRARFLAEGGRPHAERLAEGAGQPAHLHTLRRAGVHPGIEGAAQHGGGAAEQAEPRDDSGQEAGAGEGGV